MKKLYFLGEYGYAYRQLLPFLEKTDLKIELITWKINCDVIELLWPERFKLIPVEGVVDTSKGYRDCTHLKKSKASIELERLGYRHFFSIDPNHKYFHDSARDVFGVLNKKIQFGEQHESKPYISVFPRNRVVQEKKNSEMTKEIEWAREKYPDKEIIGHGLKQERLEIEGLRYVTDLNDKINVLNNSLFLITPPSGFADFALMCGCDIILTGEYKSIEKTNPHGCKITYMRL